MCRQLSTNLLPKSILINGELDYKDRVAYTYVSKNRS